MGICFWRTGSRIIQPSNLCNIHPCVQNIGSDFWVNRYFVLFQSSTNLKHQSEMATSVLWPSEHDPSRAYVSTPRCPALGSRSSGRTARPQVHRPGRGTERSTSGPVPLKPWSAYPCPKPTSSPAGPRLRGSMNFTVIRRSVCFQFCRWCWVYIQFQSRK